MNKLDFERPYRYQKGEASIWTDPYISRNLLQAHLDPSVEGASRSFEFIDQSVEWIHQQLPTKKRVVDFGCGPGLYTERLAKKGYLVTGLDFSRRSIDYAKASAARQKLEIHYVQADYLNWLPEEKFDLALLVYCDYGALSEEERINILATIYQALEVGGCLLMDNFTTAQLKDFENTTSWSYSEEADFWTEEPHLLLNREQQYDGQLTLSQTIVWTAQQSTTYNIWKYYSDRASLIAELEAAGFTVKGVYRNVMGETYRESDETIAIMAEKR